MPKLTEYYKRQMKKPVTFSSKIEQRLNLTVKDIVIFGMVGCVLGFIVHTIYILLGGK